MYKWYSPYGKHDWNFKQKIKLLKLDWIEPKWIKSKADIYDEDWKQFISITLMLPERGAGHAPEE